MMQISRSVVFTVCLLAGFSTVSMGSENKAVADFKDTGAESNIRIERCTTPMGTIAIGGGSKQDWWHDFHNATNVTSVEPLIGLVVRQSNCFTISSMGNLSQTAPKQPNGQKGGADYYLEPSKIIISNSAVDSGHGDAANTNSQPSSEVTLSLFAGRSSMQVGISLGTASTTNYEAALSALGNKDDEILAVYQATPAGKATVAAFLDAYNSMMFALNYRAVEGSGGK
ncbi:MAG: hypothetical protein CSB24_04580 [Deltaproteobacteria bacterium]|nr:MAG: hypothetical protein CSB24_04580 [Deltaproteobacteria bacterium]